jgi:glycosyltransferase involved in cell wall biosynthesis
MYWQFLYPKRIAFAPPDYEDPGLGGSEASLVLLSRELARQGEDVDVFACCYSPGVYDGVTWRLVPELDDSPRRPDVAVAVRFADAVRSTPNLAGCNMFWMLDGHTQGAEKILGSRGPERARVVTASAAQERRLQAVGISDHFTRIPLPVETARYQGRESGDALACLHSSMPPRGLERLLGMWPAIRAAVPQAELWITSGWDLWGYSAEETADRWHDAIGDGPLPDGAQLFGSVTRQRLIELQSLASLGLFPSRYPEMFCLAAAECQAAGTPVIASDLEALSERVVDGRTGVLVPGRIKDPAVQRVFVEETVRLLEDGPLRERLGRAAAQESLNLAVDSVASRWRGVASELLDPERSL